LEAASVVVVAGISVALLQLLISPLFLERVLISFSLMSPDAPIGILQQAHLTFPKPLPFSITAPSGDDMPFFTWHSLSKQGLSFYLGLAGLFVGLRIRNIGLAGASLLGWLTMLWLLLVDMGEYRAEPLRLFLLAHLGFGGSVGLMIGLGVQKALNCLARNPAPSDSAGLLRFRELSDRMDRTMTRYTGFFADRSIRSGVAIVLAGAILLCGWMARGSERKFLQAHPLSVGSVKRLAALNEKKPESWHFQLRMSTIEFDAFKLLEGNIKLPSERLLLKISPDQRLKEPGSPLAEVTPMINAAAITGAGIIGVSQEHAPPHMSVAIYPYDYTASLFWQNPTVELLRQLSPNWILVDPSQVLPAHLDQIKAMPGISPVWTLNEHGEQRILLKYDAQPQVPAGSALGVRLTIEPSEVQTTPFALVEVAATPESGVPGATMKTALLVDDDQDQPANVMDSPIVDAVRIDDRHYRLTFSMIQPGRWRVYFVDPSDRTRLNRTPLLVDVKE